MKQRSTTGVSGILFSGTLVVALLAFGIFFDRTAAVEASGGAAMDFLDRDLAREGWSPEVRQIAAWAISSNDHAGRPFVVIDQVRARLFAFAGTGRLVGSTPILRGPAWHDQSLPPGRFVADSWRSARSDAVVWANERRALALRAAPANPASRQLVSTARDDDVQGGSLHVAGDFYRRHLSAFRDQNSVAYVLPDVLPGRRNFIVYAQAHPSASWPEYGNDRRNPS